MTFDWLDYLTLAQNLAGQTVIVSEQAKLRSAISRAYYAAFHQAKQVLIVLILYTINCFVGSRHETQHVPMSCWVSLPFNPTYQLYSKGSDVQLSAIT